MKPIKIMTYPAYQDHKSFLPTGNDILGPFYLPGAPLRRKIADNPTLFLKGVVTDTDGKPIPNVLLDFWQADENGAYDEHGWNFRGRQWTLEDGTYSLETVQPGFYKISEPGTPDEFRCSHIHVKLLVYGMEKLTTQLYFADDPELNAHDHWFDPRRVVKDDGEGRVSFDFVLAREQ